MGRKPNKQNTIETVEYIGLQTIIGTGKYSLKLGVEKQGVDPKIAKMLIAKGAATLKD